MTTILCQHLGIGKDENKDLFDEFIRTADSFHVSSINAIEIQIPYGIENVRAE